MDSSNGRNDQNSSHVLIGEAALLLEEAIALVLSRWTALQMAIENEWGGRDTHRRSEELASDIFSWFTQSREPLYIDDLENLLYENMELSFNTEIDDGSVEEVVEQLMVIHEDLLQGNYESIEKLRKTVPTANAVSRSRKAMDGNESSDEEGSDMMVDEPPRSEMSADTPKPTQTPDEEGWCVVPPRRNNDPQIKAYTPTSSMHACKKIPPSLANTIIHYAASNITPQQTFSEISVTARVLENKSPCNFLVFGLGNDSPMWSALNLGGRTVYLEEDKAWMEKIREKFPELESYHATYNSKVRDADDLLELRKKAECTVVSDARYSKCQLALTDLPSVFYEVEWDLIMVDAPTGYFIDAPGRMGAIYTAGLVARLKREGETDVFVHDVDRVVEDKFSKAFLCDGYLMEQEGRLRHFTIPSHRSNMGLPFCP